MLGITAIAYGEYRRATVTMAIREGEFVEAGAGVTVFITVVGVVVAVGLLALILATN